jgi:hypothetical protein
VANHKDALRIDVKPGSDDRIFEEINCGSTVFDAAGLREPSRATPRTPVMKGEHDAGYAWYRMRVVLPNSSEPLAFAIYPPASAVEVYIDGNLVGTAN